MPGRFSRALAPALVVAGLIAAGAYIFARQLPVSTASVPPPAFDPAPVNAIGSRTAVLAGGCFWGVQGVFQHVKGVSRVVSGYTGGAKPNPTYEEVSTETTGHAESVEITFDPAQVSYGRLLQVYFAVAHDPTQLNRQGPDEGPSYRSNIFYVDDAQKRVAEAYIAQLEQAQVFPAAMVTRVDKLSAFYPAEDYHQDFLLDHPAYPYIVINDLPKVAALQKLLPDLYRKDAVRVRPR